MLCDLCQAQFEIGHNCAAYNATHSIIKEKPYNSLTAEELAVETLASFDCYMPERRDLYLKDVAEMFNAHRVRQDDRMNAIRDAAMIVKEAHDLAVASRNKAIELIENAPHEEACSAAIIIDESKCDCWKVDALKELKGIKK